ncbi:MAG TPA: SpoIIE family protein phosphatase [bacterium]|nr:SpoIIE family protein phosphatase [bacterium]
MSPRPALLSVSGGAQSPLRQVVVALLCTSVLTLGMVWLRGKFPSQFLFVPIPVIGGVAYYAGPIAGYGSALLCVGAVWSFIISPERSFAMSPGTFPLLGLFALAAWTVAFSGRRLRRVEEAQRHSVAVQQFLADVGALLSGASLDVSARLSGLANFCVPTFADWCAVDVADAAGIIRTLVVAHRDPLKLQVARELQERYPPTPESSQGSMGVIRTGQSELFEVITERFLEHVAPNADYLSVLRRLGLASAMIVAIRGRDRILGALTFASAEARRRYGRGDLGLAEEIGLRAGLALDNAALYQSEQATRIAADTARQAADAARHEADAARHEAEVARAGAERATDRIARLQAITAALSEALTPAQVAEVIVDRGIAALDAQTGTMCLLSEDGQTLDIVRAIGIPEGFIGRWHHIPITTRIAITDAVRRRQLVFLPSRNAGVAQHPDLAELQGALEWGARVAVPLMVQGRPIGALLFVTADSRLFPENDRAFLESLGRLCAQALERARFYEREHRIAGALQRAFLPEALPILSGVTIHAAYAPGSDEAEIGGDWYDAFALPTGHVMMSVGDVVGHGLHAALIMGQLRQTVRAAALEGYAPWAILRRAGEVLTATSAGDGMATAIVGELDADTLTVTLASAGHPPPMLGTSNGRVEILPITGGPPLGAPSAHGPAERIITLPAGSLLVLYTDGLIEMTRDPIKGSMALQEAMRAVLQTGADDPARAILAHVLPQESPPRDDIALITVSVAPISPHGSR